MSQTGVDFRGVQGETIIIHGTSVGLTTQQIEDLARGVAAGVVGSLMDKIEVLSGQLGVTQDAMRRILAEAGQADIPKEQLVDKVKELFDTIHQKPEFSPAVPPAGWNHSHTVICFGLALLSILDGLVVMPVGPLASAIRDSLELRSPEIKDFPIVQPYLAGVLPGALLFGFAISRWQLGRRMQISLTALIYVLGTFITGFAWDSWTFALCRFITGVGMGCQYVIINCALQEEIPARNRDATVIAVNGTFWFGAIVIDALVSTMVLDPETNPQIGWRTAFWVIASVVGLFLAFFIRWMPDSKQSHIPPDTIGDMIQLMLGERGSHALVSLTLMTSQSFLYNVGTFDSEPLRYSHDVTAHHVSRYVLPLMFGNLLGALCLGFLFDRAGRKLMIMSTYTLSGILPAITGSLSLLGALGCWGFVGCWTAIFFSPPQPRQPPI